MHGTRGKMSRLDWPLFLIALLLCGIGLINVYSGTRIYNTPGLPLFARQLVWIGMGIFVFFLFYLSGDGFVEQIANLFFYFILACLALVLLAGSARMGAQRWIAIGGFNFQPSEFAKIALVLVFSRFFADRYGYAGIGFVEMLPAVGIALVPFALVALQPDLGTAGIFLIILAGMMVVAGVRLRVLLSLTALAALAVPALWFVMKDYQKQRVLTFLDPERDPLGAGYHVIQSQIAVGSGGFLGKGYLHGTQGSLRFLPEQHTDFAFAVFAEEWGFLGAIVLLALFGLLVYRGFHLAARSQDRFASFVCGGMTVYFLAHIAINLAMVCGLFPVVGIPLPFVSYGGSSMMTNMMALGIIANVARTRYTFQGQGGSETVGG
ncbi:MAG TPA: rod shape-determining protein RodA [Candidatus Deferrimicrobiaceae bacterium]